MAGLGLWDMMDHAIANELGVDVETYIKIIDTKCTEEEANFIILTILEEDQNNLEKAKEQIEREPMKLPTVHVRDGIYCLSTEDVLLFDYESHPVIKAPLSN